MHPHHIYIYIYIIYIYIKALRAPARQVTVKPHCSRESANHTILHLHFLTWSLECVFSVILWWFCVWNSCVLTMPMLSSPSILCNLRDLNSRPEPVYWLHWPEGSASRLPLSLKPVAVTMCDPRFHAFKTSEQYRACFHQATSTAA